MSSIQFTITIPLPNSNEYLLDLELFDKIVPDQTQISYLSTKIEVKMKKASGIRWQTLDNTGKPATQYANTTSTSTSTPSPSAPSPAVAPNDGKSKKKNWDKIVDEVAGGEPLDEQDSLNKVFQEIYSNGSDEQKRAMMKSFVSTTV